MLRYPLAAYDSYDSFRHARHHRPRDNMLETLQV
jgi:hypothetical protein